MKKVFFGLGGYILTTIVSPKFIQQDSNFSSIYTWPLQIILTDTWGKSIFHWGNTLTIMHSLGRQVHFLLFNTLGNLEKYQNVEACTHFIPGVYWTFTSGGKFWTQSAILSLRKYMYTLENSQQNDSQLLYKPLYIKPTLSLKPNLSLRFIYWNSEVFLLENIYLSWRPIVISLVQSSAG